MARRKLSEYVDEVFDPAALDEATEGTEPWIEAMLADARWRQLIYEQLSKHPASILLRAVVQAVVQTCTTTTAAKKQTKRCKNFSKRYNCCRNNLHAYVPSRSTRLAWFQKQNNGTVKIQKLGSDLVVLRFPFG